VLLAHGALLDQVHAVSGGDGVVGRREGSGHKLKQGEATGLGKSEFT
jgi:hypothetical protein